MRSSMLSTVPVTSDKIFSAVEAKITSFIGMKIFNNGIQFRIGEEETSRAMIRAARKVSRDCKLPGRDTMRGTLLDNFFENHIKNQREKLVKGADIYRIHFQGDGAIIKDIPIINILAGGFTNLCQYKIFCIVQVTSQVFTRRMLNLLWRFYLVQ